MLCDCSLVIPLSVQICVLYFCIFLIFSFSVTNFFWQVLQVSAEADTFFCFVELLSGFRDNFVQQLDNSVVGIRATITRLSLLLKDHDEELWRHLEFSAKVRHSACCYIIDFMICPLQIEFSISQCKYDMLKHTEYDYGPISKLDLVNLLSVVVTFGPYILDFFASQKRFI